MSAQGYFKKPPQGVSGGGYDFEKRTTVYKTSEDDQKLKKKSSRLDVANWPIPLGSNISPAAHSQESFALGTHAQTTQAHSNSEHISIMNSYVHGQAMNTKLQRNIMQHGQSRQAQHAAATAQFGSRESGRKTNTELRSISNMKQQ